MTTRLTFPASMFSVVCQRCGSTVRKNADSCPNCGADRSAAFGHNRGNGAVRTEPRGSMFEQQISTPLASASASGPASGDDEPGMHSGWPRGWDAKRASERIAQKAAEHRAKRVEQSARNAYADPSNDSDALPGSDRWNAKKTLIAGACGLALAAGVIVYMQHGSDDDAAPSTDLSVSGAIDPKLGAFARGETDAPAPAPQAQVAPKETARTIAPGDALHGMRVALDQHDLTLARARMKALPAQQQARPEFDAMKDELVKYELQRDAALQLARACERTSAWACVQQNAAEALALDGGNSESQAMLERVITHAGWLVATPQGVKKGTATAGNAASGANASNASNASNEANAAAGSVTVAPPAPAAVTASPAPTPAQANVASVPAPGTADALAAKPAPEKRSAQRGMSTNAAAAAAARQAALDEARADGEYASRAEKIARAQAATNAVVAATILAPTPPAATTTAKPTADIATATPAVPAMPAVPAAPPAAAPKPAPQPSTVQSAPAAPPARSADSGNGLYVAPGLPNSNGMYVAPSSTQNEMYVAPAAPNGMYVAPSTRPAPSAAPAPAPAPRVAPAGAQSSALPATTQTALSQPSAAHALPTGAQAVRPSGAEHSAVATVSTVTTALPAATVSEPARAASTFGASRLTPHNDTDKTDDVERAIKQYGWTNGTATPKPAP